MKLLLDTCTLLWWWSEPEKLSKRSLSLLKDPHNTVYVSAATAWEIATKYRIGKYPKGAQVMAEWEERLSRDAFQELPIHANHALRAGTLSGDHRDPFDRMLAAQGIIEGLPVVTPDTAVMTLGAEKIW